MSEENKKAEEQAAEAAKKEEVKATENAVTKDQIREESPKESQEETIESKVDSTETVVEESADDVKNETVEEIKSEVAHTKADAEEVLEEKKAEEIKVESTDKVKEEETPAAPVAEAEAEETTTASDVETDEDENKLSAEQVPEMKEEKDKTKKSKPQLDENFDWESIGKKQDVYESDERSKLEDVYGQSLKSITEHEVIEGSVVSISTREIVVNIGYKSDGLIPASEVRYNPDLKIGDKLDVYVENQENTRGQLQLSHKKARILQSWDRVNVAHDKDEIITGFVKSRTKGGLIVDVFGIESFLPGSQIDVKPIRDYDIYVGKNMEFKVVKINHEFKNVVVSHKALIEDELEAQKAEIIAKLEKGQVLEGIVKNITSYGVFVDLGGVDGLIHITDLSWGRITHPEEIVKLDEKINVVILNYDENKKRIALGLKQLTPHPWDALDKDLKIGDKVKGKVVVIADYGAFIEIQPGIEGLIHVSEMSWSQHLRTAHDFVKVGDELEAEILTLDRDERKMSLGMKQLIPDPWSDIASKYPVKSKHNAEVRNFTNFGIFVELEEGVDGLIHISDLSWSKKIKHPAEFTKIGDRLDVVVLEVDEENRRLSLGHKQLEENPWDVFETVFALNSVHKGTITSMNDKGAVVSLPYGVEGFVPNRHLKKEDNSKFFVDEALDFMVIEFSKESKKIILSHVNTWKAREKRSSGRKDGGRDAVKRVNESNEATTLGDLDSGELAKLKSEMEKK
jgi:small subunit ribosomal protein S1